MKTAILASTVALALAATAPANAFNAFPDLTTLTFPDPTVDGSHKDASLTTTLSVKSAK